MADGTATYTEQDHSKATLAPKLKKFDGFVDFNKPAETLRRKILGFWPWPGASATYLSKKSNKSVRVTVALAEVVETSNPTGLPAGTLDANLNMICGKNGLKITKIKPAGSPLMDFKDFANGRQTQPGDLFMKIDKPDPTQ
jgi:methionyl-tRNA formyltransferase